MWLLGSARIYVQEINEGGNQQVARIQPLQGPTKHHLFGYESPTINVSAIIVGDDTKAYIMNLRATQTTYVFSGPFGDYGAGDYFVKSVNFKPKLIACQTIDTNYPINAPVYDVEIELYKDE